MLLLLLWLSLLLERRLLMLDLLLLMLLVNLCKLRVSVHLLIRPLSLGRPSVLKAVETLVFLVLLPDLPFVDLSAADVLATHD